METFSFLVTYHADGFIRQTYVEGIDKAEAWKAAKAKIAIKGMRKITVLKQK